MPEPPEQRAVTAMDVPSASLRTAFDKIVNQSLRPVALWLAALYVILAAGHLALLPPAVAPTMSLLAFTSAVGLLLLYYVLGQWPAPDRLAHVIAGGIAGVILTNSLLHLFLIAAPEHTTNLILLVIGAGCTFLSSRWLATVLLAAIMGWGGIAWTASFSPEWAHYGFALFMATILSVLIHQVRIRTLRQLEGLHLRDARQKSAIEASMAELQQTKEELEFRVIERTAALEKANIELRQELTERKKAEEALRQSEERYRTLVEQAADAIFVANAQGYLLDVNTSGCIISGYAKEELLQMRLSQLIVDEDLKSVPFRVEDVRAGKTVVNERRLKRKDGAQLIIESTVKILTDGRIQGIVRDITARKHQEETIRRLNAELARRVVERTAQLEAANKDLEAFSYSVSHDLRAPLRAVSGFAEIIARRHRPNLNEEGQHYVDNIVEASARMSRLIDDLLTYSRVGRRALSLKPVPLKDVFLQAARDLTPRITATRADLALPDVSPAVMGDITLLNQIFMNLLDNALLYHKPTTTPHITVSCQSHDGQILVRVADEGIGIPTECQEKIFHMFQRLHGEEAYPGTGIGLAIVKKSVELLGGRIWVESEVDKGSTFVVELQAALR